MKDLCKNLIVIVLSLTTVSFAANAQESGDKAAGANFVISDLKIKGVGAKYFYYINKSFRMESSFNYMFNDFIPHKWDLHFNGQILISITDRFKIYPLAGLGFVRKNNYVYHEEEEFYYTEVLNSTTAWGSNLGAGIDYRITDKLILNLELYQKGSDQASYFFSTGIIHKF